MLMTGLACRLTSSHLNGTTAESQLVNYLRLIHEERDSKLIPSDKIFDTADGFWAL